MKPIRHSAVVDESCRDRRFDQAAADLFPDYSRARLQQWIKDAKLTLNGRSVKPNARVRVGDRLDLEAQAEPVICVEAENLPLDLLRVDDHVIVLNKPAGLVVHPAPGHRSGTLQNALLHHFPELDHLPRAGIVHRLDMLTSGVMVVARSLTAHKSLVDQLQARTMHREYFALALGDIVSGGTVDLPIGRHPRDRKRMAVVSNGKTAVTDYRIEERFTGLTALRVKLHTGRTHQIRVHLSHQGYPLVGDPVYGGRNRPPKGLDESRSAAVRAFSRQALHARILRFTHPESGALVADEAPLPDDLTGLLTVLREGA